MVELDRPLTINTLIVAGGSTRKIYTKLIVRPRILEYRKFYTFQKPRGLQFNLQKGRSEKPMPLVIETDDTIRCTDTNKYIALSIESKFPESNDRLDDKKLGPMTPAPLIDEDEVNNMYIQNPSTKKAPGLDGIYGRTLT